MQMEQRLNLATDNLSDHCQANNSQLGHCAVCSISNTCCADMCDDVTDSDASSSCNEYVLEEGDTDLDVEDGLEDDELSDSEILHRLFFSTIDRSSVEEPLAVIWEHSDEDDTSTLDLSAEESEGRSTPEAMPLLVPSTSRPHSSHISVDKANDLIYEIENCFVETALMVEKTLVKSSESSRDGRSSSSTSLASSDHDSTIHRDQLSKTVKEALTIFDSLLKDNVTGDPAVIDCHVTACSDRRSSFADSNDEFCYHENEILRQEHIDPDYVNIPKRNRPYDHSRPTSIHSVTSEDDLALSTRVSCDAEIDRLFRECYDVTAVEPSTTLDSCLRNLESLCSHLKNTRNNILQNLSEPHLNEQIEQTLFEQPSCDSLFKESMNLVRHERFSVINQLIERAITKRKVAETYIPSPPLIGLEGKTHKIIAQVPHIKTENGGLMESCANLNIHSRPSDERGLAKPNSNDNPVDYSSTEDPYVMSYEETLALYKDNQELQESLLSILHSLNDIHDNFLNRRRVESNRSQKTSDILHTKIISLLSENKNKEAQTSLHDYANLPPLESPPGDDLEADFDAIHKIIGISEELKHLWLTQFRDLNPPTSPRRTVSFKDTPKRPSQAERSSWTDMKCASLPNLAADCAEDLQLVPVKTNAMDGVREFIDTLKEDNRKCYEITLNFLQKIMDIYARRDSRRHDLTCDFYPERHMFQAHSYSKIH